MLRRGPFHASNSCKAKPFFFPAAVIEVCRSLAADQTMEMYYAAVLHFSYAAPIQSLTSLPPSIAVQMAVHHPNPYIPKPVGSFWMDVLTKGIRCELSPIPTV
jgi:hypothetical protein